MPSIVVSIPKIDVIETLNVFEISQLLRKAGMPISYKNYQVRYGYLRVEEDLFENIEFSWKGR